MLHIGSNDINNQTKDKIHTEKLTENFINTGKSCIDLGLKHVLISSILPKNNIALACLIRLVNNSLRKHLVLNGFGIIFSDRDLGSNILAGNFVDFSDRFVLSRSSEYSWLYTDNHSKGLYGNIGVLISDNSLSPEIVGDISNLGSVSSNWNSGNVKGDKNSSYPRLDSGNLKLKHNHRLVIWKPQY